MASYNVGKLFFNKHTETALSTHQQQTQLWHNVTTVPLQDVSECHGAVSSDAVDEQHIVLIVVLCVSAIILLIGLVCNTLAIVVCLKSGAIRSSTTGHFLMAISAADLLYIVGDVLRALNTSVLGRHYILGIDFMDTYDVPCKLIYHLRYAGIFSCSWLTVAITVERFISVAMPLKVSRISTTQKVKAVIAAIFVVSLTLGSFPLWTVGVEYDPYVCRQTCTVLHPAAYYLWWDVWVRYLSLFAASAIIFTLVGLILFFLRRAYVVRQSMECRSMLARDSSNSSSQGQRRSIERQLTAMFLAMALAFILLRLPYIIMYEIHDKRELIWKDPDVYITKIVYITFKASDLLFLSNYSANFFIYCLCGSVFRRQTLHLIRHLSRKMTVSTSGHAASVIPMDDYRVVL